MAVYASVPGILVDHLEPGTALKAGQPFARLENSEIDFQIVQLTSERDQLRKYCDLLRQQQVQDGRAGVVNVRAQLPIAQQSLRDLEKQLQQREADREQLSLRAPCDGILVAARSRSASLSNDQLNDWEGNPLASENIGCFLEAGVLVGYVVASREVEALVMLDQSVAGEIVAGQSTRIQIDELPAMQLHGRIAAISSTTAEDLPPELVAKGWFSVPERDGKKGPQGSYYQAKVLFEQPTIAPFGSSGRARISVAPQSLFDRARDSLLRTFRFSK
jgi:multidrug efflux pump subunit AcrA (membrane-fusion protein)